MNSRISIKKTILKTVDHLETSINMFISKSLKQNPT